MANPIMVLDMGFTSYVASEPPDPPDITSIDPDSGVSTGGTPVSAHGTDFIPGATIKIDGNLCSNIAFQSSLLIVDSLFYETPCFHKAIEHSFWGSLLEVFLDIFQMAYRSVVF